MNGLYPADAAAGTVAERKSVAAALSDTRIPLAIPDLRGNEAAYLGKCVADNWVSSAGPAVTAFEREVAKIAATDYCVATTNGSAALHLALVVAGVTPGDAVVVPDFTFAATANAVMLAGARPYFVDIDPASWTIDPALVEKVLSEGDDIAAVIAVDVLGHTADIDALQPICAERGVPLIEDAAGAIGASYRNRPAGGLGDVGMFSFNGNKAVTTGGGGALVTNRQDWAARARRLSTQSRVGAAYRYDEAAFNYRMPNINAALGLAQLERLDAMLADRRRIAAWYDAGLAGLEGLEPAPRPAWSGSSCWLYSVRVETPDKAASLISHLERRAIEARTFWEPLSDQAPYRHCRAQTSGVAARLGGCVVSLPSSSNLSERDVRRVIAAVSDWSEGRKQ